MPFSLRIVASTRFCPALLSCMATTALLCIATAAVPDHSTSLTKPTSLSYTAARNGIPIYGEWCGPFHGGNDDSLGCIDDIDCACKTHDLCYEDHGYLNCKCDRNLVEALDGRTNAVAVTIRGYFRGSPCLAPVNRPGTCSKCRTKWGVRFCYPYLCTKCSMVPMATATKLMVSKYKC